MSDMRKLNLIDVFLTFAKIGCFTFGGGYAMLPFIEQEVVTKNRWVNHEEMVDILAVSQAVPGAVAINAATFIGQKLKGSKGAFAATLGVVSPSVVIITIIAAFFSHLQNNPVLDAAFAGVRPAVTGLIAVAAYRVIKSSVKDKWDLIVVVAAALIAALSDVHVIVLIMAGAVLGFVMNKARHDGTNATMDRQRQSNDNY